METMRFVSAKTMLAVLGVAALGAGCATRLEMGPGYYSYDTRAVSAVTVQPVTVRVGEPVVVYGELPAAPATAAPAIAAPAQ
jgi:hypothetical protein